MLSRRSHKSRIFCLLLLAIILLFVLRPYPRIHLTKTIQFEHDNGDFGAQLFSLFSLLGVAQSLDRIPVLNVFNNSELLGRLSQFAAKFPMVFEQYHVVIEPNSQPNAELGMNSCCYFDDATEKLSEYTTIDLVVRGKGFRSFKYFHHLRPEIRHWMLGNAENVEEARHLLPEHLRPTFKLCVHGSAETDAKFTIIALKRLLEVYMKEHQQLTVVMWSMSEHLGQKILNHSRLSNFTMEKFYLPDPSPATQLTFSQLYCDAVLLTVPTSTLGWWMGYLAKEESTVFYANSTVTTPEDYFLREWKRMFLSK